MSYIAWLVVFVVFAALELVSLGLTCIWFAIGALAGCVAALLGANWIVQAVDFSGSYHGGINIYKTICH